jgi:hypothetical protein
VRRRHLEVAATRPAAGAQRDRAEDEAVARNVVDVSDPPSISSRHSAIRHTISGGGQLANSNRR